MTMKKTIKAINALVKRGLIKDYAIGGAIGVLRWVEPFFTRDLDIFVILRDEIGKGRIVSLGSVYEGLKKEGYDKWTGQWIIIEGVPVEFFPADDLAKEAIQNAEETKFGGVKTKIMTPEYLIALLLRAGRDKDKRKIEMMLEQARINKSKLKKLLDRYELSARFGIIAGRGAHEK